MRDSLGLSSNMLQEDTATHKQQTTPSIDGLSHLVHLFSILTPFHTGKCKSAGRTIYPELVLDHCQAWWLHLREANLEDRSP
jgi:hypothetical protein